MTIDRHNRVVRLCADGMEAEGNGMNALARSLFLEAYEMARDDYERCIAAHYVARHQETPFDTLRWNRIALDHADTSDDPRIIGFHPSLLLCLGRSYEAIGDPDEARRWYERAGTRTGDLSDDGYGRVVRAGVEAALVRTH